MAWVVHKKRVSKLFFQRISNLTEKNPVDCIKPFYRTFYSIRTIWFGIPLQLSGLGNSCNPISDVAHAWLYQGETCIFVVVPRPLSYFLAKWHFDFIASGPKPNHKHSKFKCDFVASSWSWLSLLLLLCEFQTISKQTATTICVESFNFLVCAIPMRQTSTHWFCSDG